MDDIWRERNAAQHTPNERKDINPRVHEAFEQKNQLGLDQGPHASAQEITALPHRIKKKWLENARKCITEKEKDNERRLAAVKALTTGSKWQWNPMANAKVKQTRTKRTEKPAMSNPWTPLETDSEPGSRANKPNREKTSKKNAEASDDEPTVHSPWDPSPMTAPAGSSASAGAATPVANTATGAAAAAAPAHLGATLAQISLAPSMDLPRKERDGSPNTSTTTPHAPTTYDTPSASVIHSIETEPTTPGQDDDPDRIDDVV